MMEITKPSLPLGNKNQHTYIPGQGREQKNITLATLLHVITGKSASNLRERSMAWLALALNSRHTDLGREENINSISILFKHDLG